MMGECDLESIGSSSMLRVAQLELLKLQKSGQFPDESVKIKGVEVKRRLTYVCF